MKKIKPYSAIGIATMILASAAPTIQAQDEKSVMEEIIVTAQKRPENLQEVPISIKALTAETLEMINADSLDDIARLVPSLSMTDLSRGGNSVQIRGLGSNVGSVGTVAIYNDGIISFGRTSSGGTFSEQDSGLYDVSRVEVLRGPQGTLYGEGSFGGVVNIISTKPNPEKFEASISAGFFDIEDGGSDSTDIAGMVNIPLIDNTLALRVVGYSNDHDGYIDGYNILNTYIAALYQSYGYPMDPMDSPPELVGEGINTEKVTGGRVMLGYTGERFDANLILKRQKLDLGIASLASSGTMKNFDDISGNTIGDTEMTAYLFDSNFGSENTTDEAILEINTVTPIGNLTSITGWGEIERENTAAIFGNSGFSQELRLSSDSEGDVNWIMGAFYRDVEATIDLIDGQGFLIEKAEQWALFGQVYYDISETLTATFGLRYGKQESEDTDLLRALDSVEATFGDLAPKVTLDWQVQEQTMVYGTVAKGFRAGGANADTSLGTDANYQQGFDSDQIWNYEVGFKSTFWDNKLVINGALFYIDWSDIQIDSPVLDLVLGEGPDSKEFIVVNGEDAHSVGFEVDMTVSPGAGWLITLGGSNVEVEFDNGMIASPIIEAAHPDGVYSLKGMRLPNAPEYLFNASAEKIFDATAGMEWFIRADYSLRGSSYSDVPNDAEGTDMASGSFDLINLRAGLRGQKWEVQAYVKNLENSDASSWNFNDGSMFGNLRARIAPRTIGINMKYSL